MRSKTDIPRYSLESVDYDSISVFYNSTWIQHQNITYNNTSHKHNFTHHTIQHNMQLDLSSIYTLQTMISYLVYNTIDISATSISY